MYRILTVAREYGSGGARIAALAAALLGWRLLDSALIDEIARAAHVDPALARRFDERVDTWLHRLSRHGLWFGAFEGVLDIFGMSAGGGEEVGDRRVARVGHDLARGGRDGGVCL